MLVGQLGVVSVVLGIDRLVCRQVLTGYPLVILDVPTLYLRVLRHVLVAGVDGSRRAFLLHDHHLVS